MRERSASDVHPETHGMQRLLRRLNTMLIDNSQISALVLDFDGTITKQDTISVLASIGQAFQRRHHHSVKQPWDSVVEAYGRDFQDYTSTYVPAAIDRTTLSEELKFLRGFRDVESASFGRVGDSEIFRGMNKEDFSMAGSEALRDGTVRLHDGFSEFMACAALQKWRIYVISVNWSSSFIRGVLSGFPIDTIISNEIRSDGIIVGPGILGPPSKETVLATCLDKAHALKALVAEQNLGIDTVVYFGDSLSDIECLIAVKGIIMSSGPDSSLIKTLKRTGVTVQPITCIDKSANLVWASNYREIMSAGLFQLV
ncbi:Bifunctional TH2 protein like [Verticillium longisporum]|nr:Bifunctional TH2 protein like [Verticillium longisporum]